jgi:hypothetical protein
MVLAPIVRGRKGEFKKEMETLVKHGYTRARIDGELVNLDDDLALDKRKNHTIEVMVDRLLVKPGIEHRLEMSVGLAMKLAGGLVQVAVVGGDEHALFGKAGLPRLRHQRASTGAALVLLQQHVRSLSRMPRPGQPLRFRSGKSDHRLVEAAARWRTRPRLGVPGSDSHAAWSWPRRTASI